MTNTATTIQADATMTNAQGYLVPISKIKPQDMLEHQLVTDLIDRALGLQSMIANFKAIAFGDCEAFQQLLADQYGTKRGGKKGNVTFTSFDGLRQVQIKVQDRLTFGPQLQVAKDLLDEFIKDEMAETGTSENIAALVMHAFEVDKEGRINTQRVLSLHRLNIVAPKWIAAMEAIRESLRVIGSASYIRFFQRDTADAPFEAIPLDIAKL